MISNASITCHYLRSADTVGVHGSPARHDGPGADQLGLRVGQADRRDVRHEGGWSVQLQQRNIIPVRLGRELVVGVEDNFAKQ